MTGNLHEHQYTLCIISRSVLLIVSNVSDRWCSEDQDTHFIFNNCFSENRAAYDCVEKIW